MGLGHLFAQGSWVQSSILVGVEERRESFAEMMTRLGSISEMMGIASMSDRRSGHLTRRVKTERGTKIILFSYCLVACTAAEWCRDTCLAIKMHVLST